MSESTSQFGFAATTLTTQDTACLLVGRFIQDWSFVEFEINKDIQKLVGLESLEGPILTANMQVRDKIFALKTLLHVFAANDADRAVSVEILKRASDMSAHRNTVAHNMFWRHEGGGVEFSITKAKGKLSFPNVIWSESDFAEKTAAMAAIKGELKAAVATATRFRARHMAAKDAKNIFANALTGLYAPTGGSEGPGGLLDLGQLALATPDSPSPIHQREPETPKAPRKKSKGGKSR